MTSRIDWSGLRCRNEELVGATTMSPDQRTNLLCAQKNARVLRQKFWKISFKAILAVFCNSDGWTCRLGVKGSLKFLTIRRPRCDPGASQFCPIPPSAAICRMRRIVRTTRSFRQKVLDYRDTAGLYSVLNVTFCPDRAAHGRARFLAIATQSSNAAPVGALLHRRGFSIAEGTKHVSQDCSSNGFVDRGDIVGAMCRTGPADGHGRRRLGSQQRDGTVALS